MAKRSGKKVAKVAKRSRVAGGGKNRLARRERVAKIRAMPQPPSSDLMDSGEAADAAQKHLVIALQQLQRILDDGREAVAVSRIEVAIRSVQASLSALSGAVDDDQALSLDAQQLAQFASQLRRQRREAGLSQEQLARLAHLSKRTIYNLEHARQAPSRATLLALLGVRALRLRVSAYRDDIESDPDWTPNSWFAPRYNPAALQQDLINVLNGPGGQIEQTFLYLEPASANDYLSLCSSAPVFVGFRNASPLEQAAHTIGRRFAGHGIDVAGLGSGDGRAECRIAQALA